MMVCVCVCARVMEEDTNILSYEFVFHVLFQVFIICVLIFCEYFVCAAKHTCKHTFTGTVL